jgi:predicted phage terminase large subunit-like protein
MARPKTAAALPVEINALTPREEQLLLLRRQHKALVAKDSLLDYIQIVNPDVEEPVDVRRSSYEAAPHHKAVIQAVQTYVTGGFPGYDILILLMPPRHGKSHIVSRHLPAWYSGRHPDENIVVATYNDDFAADFGADVRTIVQSAPHKLVFPKYYLKQGGSAKDRLQTTRGGMLMFVGRGGSLTGRGAHLLIGDDLIKDDKEAQSQAIRDAAWNWLTRVAMTRRMGARRVILTFTRWHADDPIGRLTDPESEHYSREIAERIKIITLPGLAEEDDPLGRKPGQALWPSRFPADMLKQMRVLDPVGFSSLYQQRPTVQDGILFSRDYVQYYDRLPTDLRFYCASDHAVATAQRNDRTALLKVGVDTNGRIYLVDLWWQRSPTDQVVEAMLQMGGGKTAPLIWWAEKGHISKSIGPFLRKRMDETRAWFNLSEVTPSGDKTQRAQAIAARMAMGHVYFPKGAWWTEKAIDELMGFPNGLHDDFVDAFAYIGLGLRSQIPAQSTARPVAKERNSFAWMKAQHRWETRREGRRDGGGYV